MLVLFLNLNIIFPQPMLTADKSGVFGGAITFQRGVTLKESEDKSEPDDSEQSNNATATK